jgi:hypothetical protein
LILILIVSPIIGTAAAFNACRMLHAVIADKSRCQLLCFHHTKILMERVNQMLPAAVPNSGVCWVLLAPGSAEMLCGADIKDETLLEPCWNQKPCVYCLSKIT